MYRFLVTLSNGAERFAEGRTAIDAGKAARSAELALENPPQGVHWRFRRRRQVRVRNIERERVVCVGVPADFRYMS